MNASFDRKEKRATARCVILCVADVTTVLASVGSDVHKHVNYIVFVRLRHCCLLDIVAFILELLKIRCSDYIIIVSTSAELS